MSGSVWKDAKNGESGNGGVRERMLRGLSTPLSERVGDDIVKSN